MRTETIYKEKCERLRNLQSKGFWKKSFGDLDDIDQLKREIKKMEYVFFKKTPPKSGKVNK